MDISSIVTEVTQGQGYVVLPDLISRQESIQARELILALAEQEKQQGKIIAHDYRERLYGLIHKGEIFSNLVQDPLIVAIVEAILGENIILGGFSAHIIHPGASGMGIHVDYPYWAMTAPFPRDPILEIQVIWMMEDFTADNGAPLFVPGSQHLASFPNQQDFDRSAIKLTGSAGSAVISHGLAWHDTSTNKSDRPRVSLLGNYTPQYIQPLENNLYDHRQDTITKATPQLKKLLRHSWMSLNHPVYDLKPEAILQARGELNHRAK